MSNSTSMRQSELALRPYSLHWGNMLFLAATPVIAVIGTPLHFYHTGISWPLMAVFLFYLIATGLSITAGYHRLFAHRSYRASPTVRLFYLLFGAAACQNSALRWATDHRNHHRFVDNEGDPYSIRRGFLYAHIGWILLKDPRKSFDGEHDLLVDSLVRWQDRFYFFIAIFVGGGLPFVIGYFLGDALGCFLLAGVTRTVIVHHSTFLINSLCHTIGKQPYSLRDSSRDSAFVALLTYGEGFHNFHHRFQYDYRNGVRWYHFDPTKWLIKSLETLRLAKDLRKASNMHIFKAQLDVQRDQAEQSLVSVSQGFQASMKRQIRTRHAALLSAYATWGQHRVEYRSVRESMGRKREKFVLKLRQDLRSARSHYTRARASWAAVVAGAHRSQAVD